MANLIEHTKISAKRFVPVSSRYAETQVVYYTENKLLTFVTYKKSPTTLGSKDRYYVVSPGTEYRPDLVSQTAYGTVDFWWKIMEANNIKDVFEFKAGLNIRIPNAILG
jgi:hypothetical protein